MCSTSLCRAIAGVSCLLAAAGFSSGCGSKTKEIQKGPSYAELVVTYNAELAALDRLEKKKEQLLAKLTAVGKPSEQDAMNMLGKLLGPAAKAGGNANTGTPSDPNAALDQAIKQAETTQEAARGMLETLGDQTTVDPQTAEKNKQAKQQLTRELESLDKEIDRQKQRVQRARKARDTAEAASQVPNNTSAE